MIVQNRHPIPISWKVATSFLFAFARAAEKWITMLRRSCMATIKKRRNLLITWYSIYFYMYLYFFFFLTYIISTMLLCLFFSEMSYFLTKTCRLKKLNIPKDNNKTIMSIGYYPSSWFKNTHLFSRPRPKELSFHMLLWKVIFFWLLLSISMQFCRK